MRKTWKPIVSERDGSSLAPKFAGHPFLRQGESWPVCQNCRQPLQLFLQLDLDALPPPLRGEFGSGLLQLFYCTNTSPDCEVECEAFFPFAKCELVRIVQPGSETSEMQALTNSGRFPPKLIVDWQALEDYPTQKEGEGLGVALSKEDLEVLYDLEYPVSGDKLAGWPHWVQGIEYPDCPICQARMRLLFQIDSNDNLPYMFGDAGCGHITQCQVHKEQVAFGWACA